MDRRDFIKSTGTLIAGATLAPGSLAAAEQSAAAADGGRQMLPMNRGWLYSRTADDAATAPGFSDAGFEHVVVPHTNIKLPWHSFTEHDYTFVSTYRRHFKLPESAMGKRVFVDFEGVMTASTVYLNGHKLGEYKGGYTPFSFELTAGPILNPGGDNVLAVQVDSTERADIPPFGDEVDYLTFGGIYREVALRIVPETFLENVFAAPKNVSTKPAVDVKCYLDHPAQASHDHYSLTAEVLDGDRVIGKGTKQIPAASLAKGELEHAIEIPELEKIELWDLNHPRLYHVRVRLLQGRDVIDEQTRPHRFPRSHVHRPRLFAQRQDHQAARPRSPPDISLRRPGDARPRAAPRCRHPPQELQVQHRAHVALSAVAALPRSLRRDWPAGARRDPRLAAHRR